MRFLHFDFDHFFKNCVHALLIKLWAYKWTNGVLGKDGVYWRYAYIIVKGKFISLEVEVSIYSIALLHFTDSRVSFSWLCDACNTNACFFYVFCFINVYVLIIASINFVLNWETWEQLIHIASHFVVFKF